MHKIKIDNNGDKVKLLKFLQRQFRDVPHSVFRRILRKGDVKINGKRTRDQNHILKLGDELQIYGIQSNKEQFKPIEYDFDIVYEDENILIADKAKGVVVHGTDDSLDMMVKSYLLKENKWDPKSSFIPSHCHRLDKWTDGLIIYGLNYAALKQLNEIIKNHKLIDKYYVAKVKGDFQINKVIKGFIKELDNGVEFNTTDGKEALTKFKTLLIEDGVTTLSCQLLTGRKHQIRATLKYLKHPIIGDNRYNDNSYGDLALSAVAIKFNKLDGLLKYLSGKEIRRNKNV